MKTKKLVLVAIICAVVSLGIGGTSSAAALTDNLLVSTVEKTVNTQNFASTTRSRGSIHISVRGSSSRNTSVRRGPQYYPPQRHYPTPRHYPPQRHHYRR